MRLIDLATRNLHRHAQAEEKLMQAIDERDMDKISDAIKVAIRVGVDSTIVSQAKASAVQIENEFAAAEAAAIEAEEAEQQGIVAEPISNAIARAQRRVNERLQKKIAVEVAEMQKKAPLQLIEGLDHKESMVKHSKTTKRFVARTHRILVKGLGGPTKSLVTNGEYKPPPPPPHVTGSFTSGGAVVIRRAPSSAKPPTVRNPEVGLSVNELQRVFPASQTAEEHADPVKPSLDDGMQLQLSMSELEALFAVKVSSTYERHAIAAEKKRVRSKIGRSVQKKIPTGWDQASWPPPPSPTNRIDRRTFLAKKKEEQPMHVGVAELLVPAVDTAPFADEHIDANEDTQSREHVSATNWELSEISEDKEPDKFRESNHTSQPTGEARPSAIQSDSTGAPCATTSERAVPSNVRGKSMDTPIPSDSCAQSTAAIIPSKTRHHKNATSDRTDTGHEKKSENRHCIRGKGWSWQPRAPLATKIEKKSEVKDGFRAEGDDAIMLSRGTSGGWKVSSSKPLGRASTHSRNLHNTKQIIKVAPSSTKRERIPYSTTTLHVNPFGARQKYQVRKGIHLNFTVNSFSSL
jgi:hypothetical protein